MTDTYYGPARDATKDFLVELRGGQLDREWRGMLELSENWGAGRVLEGQQCNPEACREALNSTSWLSSSHLYQALLDVLPIMIVWASTHVIVSLFAGAMHGTVIWRTRSMTELAPWPTTLLLFPFLLIIVSLLHANFAFGGAEMTMDGVLYKMATQVLPEPVLNVAWTTMHHIVSSPIMAWVHATGSP